MIFHDKVVLEDKSKGVVSDAFHQLFCLNYSYEQRMSKNWMFIGMFFEWSQVSWKEIEV